MNDEDHDGHTINLGPPAGSPADERPKWDPREEDDWYPPHAPSTPVDEAERAVWQCTPVHTCGAINAPCEHPICAPAPGEGTAWTDADRDRVWPEGWLKCPLHPDQHGDVYHSANWHEDRPPASGEGTRQRPGGWIDGIGWVVRSTDLRPGDKDEAAWVVRPGEVGSPFYSLAVVTRWADGTSPAPPAPLTRPDTAALRRFADGMVYDDLLTAARKGCFCEPHSKPCSDHMMYADGLEAGLRAATSPGTGDNP